MNFSAIPRLTAISLTDYVPRFRGLASGALCCILAGQCVSLHCQAISQPETSRTTSAAVLPPRLPNPSGPLGVGRVGYDWIDTSRRDRFAASPEAHRELMVYLWYPTSQNSAGIKGVYWPGAKQIDSAPEVQHAMREDYGATWPLIVSGAIYSHAVDGAPVAKAPKKFPVILFSHGLGGSGFAYTSVIEDLTSHGYVVAAIEHTETAGVVLFPDGRMIRFHQDSMPPGLSDAERLKHMMASATAGMNEGADDVRFVLNRLTELNAGSARDFALAGRLDLSRAAAMGHSAGAEFAALACEQDPRLKACVDLDGGMVPVAALPEGPDGAIMQQPLLFLEAYHPESKMFGTPAQHQEYFKKREEQLRKCRAGSYAVVLRSAGIVHSSFSDYSLLTAGDRPDVIETALHNLDLIETFIRAFLDKSLRDDKQTLFEGDYVRITEATVQPLGH